MRWNTAVSTFRTDERGTGTERQRERRRNWTMKTAPKSMVRMAKRDMLNMPRMVPRAAKKKLWGWGHWPC